MGAWDEYCTVCGGPPRRCAAKDVLEFLDPDREDSLLSSAQIRARLKGGTAWLEKHVGIGPDEGVMMLGRYTGHGSFPLEINNGFEFHGSPSYHPQKNAAMDTCGVICHRACRTLLRKELGYTLKFSDVWPLLMKTSRNSRRRAIGGGYRSVPMVVCKPIRNRNSR